MNDKGPEFPHKVRWHIGVARCDECVSCGKLQNPAHVEDGKGTD